MGCDPVIVNSLNDAGCRLTGVVSTPNDPRDEKWLQELLYSHPELLPVDQFETLYSPLIPIGREVPTEAGPIDNLYVSPEGMITIVETKLWKNPDKHRTVVAQVIDYAKELATWDYEVLQEAVLASSRKRGETENASLEQKVAHALSANEIDKEYHDFLESVAACLASARFLLLIVGDRIARNVALLTKAVHAAPGLHFRLGLVEMHMYQHTRESHWPLIVVPEVVGRTVEVPRGVVTIAYTDTKPKVDVTVDEIGSDGSDTAKRLDLDRFMQAIPKDLVQPYKDGIEAWEAAGGTITFTNEVMFFEMNLAGISQRIVRCRKYQVAMVRRTYCESWGGNGTLYDDYLNDLEAAPAVADYARSDKTWIKYKKISGDDLRVMLRAAMNLVEGIKSQEE